MRMKELQLATGAPRRVIDRLRREGKITRTKFEYDDDAIATVIALNWDPSDDMDPLFIMETDELIRRVS